MPRAATSGSPPFGVTAAAGPEYEWRVTFVDAYLERIGLPRPEQPDAAGLRALHAAHLDHVPFENLDVALGVPVQLTDEALIDKIIDRRRGGFCYELNGLFARLLAALGYDVTLLAGRVWSGRRWSPPFDHLALQVGCADGTGWLADVGFGAHSRYPVRLDHEADQDDPFGTFRVEDVGGDLRVAKDGSVEYLLERHPRELADFTAMCWYQQHSPMSHFSRNTICSRPTPAGRVSLREDVLIVTAGGAKHETKLADDAAILAAYRTHFDIDLDRVPRIETR